MKSVDNVIRQEEIKVTYTITLNDKDARKYLELDALLRTHTNKEIVTDLMSDMGYSYVNDTLVTINWESIDTMLEYVKDAIKGGKRNE